MFYISRRALTITLLQLLTALMLAAVAVAAQEAIGNEKEEPPFHEYKGVRIGMTAEEARKKLGAPADKSDQQDFYSFSDAETAQIFYDQEKKVRAISVTYMGANASAPAPKAVFGTDIEKKPDGSMYRMDRFTKVGYWLSYTRTAGDAPMTIVTLHKID